MIDSKYNAAVSAVHMPDRIKRLPVSTKEIAL